MTISKLSAPVFLLARSVLRKVYIRYMHTIYTLIYTVKPRNGSSKSLEGLLILLDSPCKLIEPSSVIPRCAWSQRCDAKMAPKNIGCAASTGIRYRKVISVGVIAMIAMIITMESPMISGRKSK